MARPQDPNAPGSGSTTTSPSSSSGKTPNDKTPLQDKASEAGEHLREAGHIAKEAAVEGIHRVRNVAREKYDEGVQKAQELTTTLEDRIREHPIRCVLIALGAGFLLRGFMSRG